LNVSDSPEIAVQMFELVNFIVDNRISQQKNSNILGTSQKALSAIENVIKPKKSSSIAENARIRQK
jgi:hypothetical protein